MQSYPSPNAVPADAQPFYTPAGQQQPGMRDAEDLQLTARLSRDLAPIMNAGASVGMTNSQDPRAQPRGNVNHQYEHEEHHPHAGHVQPSHSLMQHMGNQYGTPDGPMAPRKRSKVSRACDECRRKKIRCDATGDEGDENTQCSSCKRVGARCLFSRTPMKRGPSKGYIKELADRLNTLEGAMQAGDIPVQHFLPHHDSPIQRRSSDDYSPPPNVENTRKRTFSAVSGGEYGAPYMQQRSQGPWSTSEAPRHLPPVSAYSPPQASTSVTTVFREPNYSPNGLQGPPPWNRTPEIVHRQSASFETITQDVSHLERSAELDDFALEGYYNIIHPCYSILSQSKAKILGKLGSCPGNLREAFFEALYAAVRSFPSSTLPPSDQQGVRRASYLLQSFQFEHSSSLNSSSSLVHLQTLMLLAVASENQAGGPSRAAGPSPSYWLGSAVGVAYSLKLYRYLDSSNEEDPDSDERLSRRIWWALVIMDRWHASSTSGPLMIPDGSVAIHQNDRALLGDSLYQIARLSIVLGHYSTVMLEETDKSGVFGMPKPVYGTLLKGELDRCTESFPMSLFPPIQFPLVHLCYWHLRILVTLRAPDLGTLDLLEPAMNAVTQLAQNPGLVSPLNSDFKMLVSLALLELTEHQITTGEAGSGLKALLENRMAPSNWDVAIREMITKRNQTIVSAPLTSLTAAESTQAAVAAQGLQHLADLATSRDITTGDDRKEEESSTSGPAGLRFKRYQPIQEIIREGYLSAFTGDAAR